MEDRLYPVSLADPEEWRGVYSTSLDEARKRFVQFAVLESIAASPLKNDLAFKGGNALRFIYRNPRGTIDLDFTAEGAFPDDADEIRRLLNSALFRGVRKYDVKARCQRIRRNPPGKDKSWPTYDTSVAYQLPRDRHFADFETWSGNLSTVVSVEISLNDVVCETHNERLAVSAGAELRVCVLEDIVAEKLRALLQQPIRNRNRSQDAYDIARLVRRERHRIDSKKTSAYLLKKARARAIEPRRSSFDDDIKSRAAYAYGHFFRRSIQTSYRLRKRGARSSIL